jgi:outer membrane receptor protein involved in Fe transport
VSSSCIIRNVVRTSIVLSSIAVLSSAYAVAEGLPRSLPPQPLADALDTFARVANLQVIYRADLAVGRNTGAVEAGLSAEQALRELLRDTGLTYTFVNDRMVAIRSEAEAAPAADDRIGSRSVPGSSPAAYKSSLFSRIRLAQADGPRLAQVSTAAIEPAASDRVIEEVRVTASRRDEKLQDVAVAVTVIDQEALARGGKTSLPEIMDFVPGVTISQFGSNYFNDVYIRGINATVVAGVGTYVDDIPYNSSTRYAGGGAPVDATLLDLEYVNVMKGPQGTLYGASAMGGVLQFKTRTPSLDRWTANSSADLSSTRSGGLNQLYRFAANGPIVQDKVSIGFSGFWKDKTGFIDNVTLDRRWDDSEYYGGAVTLFAAPTENLTLKALAMYQNSEQEGRATIEVNGRDGFPAPGLAQGQPIYGELETGESVLNPSVFESSLFGLTAEYDFGPATLTSVSSYQELERVQLLDFTVQFVGLADQLFPQRAPHTSATLDGSLGWEKVVQEIRLTSESNGKFEWIAGTYYSKEEGFNVQDLVFVPAEPTFYYANFPSTYEEAAAFGTATYFFTPDLDVSAGIRYSETESRLALDNNGSLLIQAIPLNVIEDEITTYLLNVRYRPSENTSIYARAASGYRPGGANFLVTNPATGELLSERAYLPDELWSYEAGIKGTILEGTFSYDLAAFFIDWQDYQIGVARGGLGVAANADESSSRGVEASLSFMATDVLRLTTAVSYIDAQLDVDEPDLGGAAGTQLPSSPKWSGALGVNYDFMLGSFPAYVGGTWHYTGEIPYGFSGYTDADGVFHGTASPRYLADDYQVLDLQAGFATARFDASLYVKNALDEYGYSTFTPSATASSLAVPLVPRTIGITLRMKFE